MNSWFIRFKLWCDLICFRCVFWLTFLLCLDHSSHRACHHLLEFFALIQIKLNKCPVYVFFFDSLFEEQVVKSSQFMHFHQTLHVLESDLLRLNCTLQLCHWINFDFFYFFNMFERLFSRKLLSSLVRTLNFCFNLLLKLA